jgi:hypothetical protein
VCTWLPLVAQNTSSNTLAIAKNAYLLKPVKVKGAIHDHLAGFVGWVHLLLVFL